MGKSLKRFEKVIKRSRDIITMHSAVCKDQNLGTLEHSDLLRSALVMAVAGMDSYFTSRFTENIVGYLKKNVPTSGMIEVLASAGLDTRQALEMLTMDRPYRRIRTLLDDHLFDHTTQRFDVIDKLFQVYKVKDLSKNAQGLSKRTELLKSVEIAVLRRHAIVHGADCNSHDKLSPIGDRWVKGKIDDVELFVRKCDELITKVIG